MYRVNDMWEEAYRVMIPSQMSYWVGAKLWLHDPDQSCSVYLLPNLGTWQTLPSFSVWHSAGAACACCSAGLDSLPLCSTALLKTLPCSSPWHHVVPQKYMATACHHSVQPHPSTSPLQHGHRVPGVTSADLALAVLRREEPLFALPLIHSPQSSGDYRKIPQRTAGIGPPS